MRNYNLIDYIERARQSRSKEIKTNNEAKEAYKSGKIGILKLYQLSMIERVATRIEFGGIMNINTVDGKTNINSGKLIKIDGNWDYLMSPGVTYYGDSIVKIYKTRYYLANGSNIVVKRVWENEYQWTSDKISKCFDLELIRILLDNLKAGKRRDFIRTIKLLLSMRYTGLTYDSLKQSIINLITPLPF